MRRVFAAARRNKDTRPITWTLQPNPMQRDDYIAIYYYGGVYVAAGAARIYTSTDPINLGWTTRYTASGAHMNGFATDGAGNYAVTFNSGSSYAVITSSNPEVSWTYHAAPAGMYPNCIGYGNGKWVIGAWPSGLIWETSNPAGTWTSVSTPLGNLDNIDTILYGKGYYVASGGNAPNGFVLTATNSAGPWVKNLTFTDSGANLQCGDFGGNYFAFGTPDSYIYYTTDPTGTWSREFVATQLNVPWHITYGNRAWVAGGNNAKISTARIPASTWSAGVKPWVGNANVVTGYGNNLWIAIGPGSGANQQWATAIPGV